VEEERTWWLGVKASANSINATSPQNITQVVPGRGFSSTATHGLNERPECLFRHRQVVAPTRIRLSLTSSGKTASRTAMVN